MPLTSYPQLLTDPVWKKVEKAAGVSDTGVGKTLRDNAKLWAALQAEIVKLENDQTTKQKADASKKSLITGLGRSETLLKGQAATISKADRKKLIVDYAKVLEYLVRDLTNGFNLVNDHRDLGFVVSKINAHVDVDVKSFKH